MCTRKTAIARPGSVVLPSLHPDRSDRVPLSSTPTRTAQSPSIVHRHLNPRPRPRAPPRRTCAVRAHSRRPSPRARARRLFGQGSTGPQPHHPKGPSSPNLLARNRNGNLRTTVRARKTSRRGRRGLRSGTSLRLANRLKTTGIAPLHRTKSSRSSSATSEPARPRTRRDDTGSSSTESRPLRQGRPGARACFGRLGRPATRR